MNKIECPIGLSTITSKKPGEIAISIIGRLLEFRTNIISTQIENKDLLNSNVK
jgi:xanthine/CO dehydrogenase XdhC/CoxF family maturation factor